MTADAENRTRPARAAHEVAGVLAALGELMKELRDQDLALQNAVSELASKTAADGEQLVHIQHIDLITQTHEDLAPFPTGTRRVPRKHQIRPKQTDAKTQAPKPQRSTTRFRSQSKVHQFGRLVAFLGLDRIVLRILSCIFGYCCHARA